MEDSRRCLLLLFFLVALLATAFSQTGCVLPTRERTEELLQLIVRQNTSTGSNVITNLTNFHYTCQALGDRVDLFRSLSIAVTYSVSSSPGTRVSQLLLTCNQNSGIFVGASPTPIVQFRNETLVFSISTRRDCRVCSVDAHVPQVYTDANCAREYQLSYQTSSFVVNYYNHSPYTACSSSCQAMGQGACTDSAGTICCPVFASDTPNQCAPNCSANMAADTNTGICGEYIPSTDVLYIFVHPHAWSG